jgi:hypothetical protein
MISKIEPIILSEDMADSHIIEGVPYIAQTEGYFCYYASFAMILNHLGMDTTLNEILFYDGLGYKHGYYPEEKLPDEGRYIGDFDFVLDLFGVEEDYWFLRDYSPPTDDLWNEYYTRLKENISKDIPIITRVDPFSMSSLRNQFRISDSLWKMLFPPSHHLIVIIGYNDTNQSICYNDPNAGFYGEDHFGDHAWMSINDFRKAVETTISSWWRYIIFTVKPAKDPLSKQDAFEKVFNKNIEKLKGNITAYYEHNPPFYRILGINASNKLKENFSEEKRSETIILYKKFGGIGFNFTLIEKLHKMFSIFNFAKPNIFDIFIIGKIDSFEDIAAEKNHIADYLEDSHFYPNICEKHASLLREEAEKWDQLSDYYKVFMRRGIFLSKYRANNIMKQMETLIDEIILIEEEIINSPI